MPKPRRIKDRSLPASWHITQSSCPACGTRLNATTAINHASPPQPGHFTICYQCSTVLRYDAAMRPVRLAAGELEALGAEDPVALRNVTLARLALATANRRTTH